MIKQIIIIGGGRSILELTELGLWDKLKGNFTIGVNFSFKDYMPTALCCADFKFYTGHIDPVIAINDQGKKYSIDNNYNKKFHDELKKLPLIVAPSRIDLSHPKVKMKNTILLPWTSAHKYYGKTNQEGEIYCTDQSGMWALGVACRLQPEEIFLLGFDFGVSGNQCHYYNHTKHRGTLEHVYGWYKRTSDKGCGADYYYLPFAMNNPNIKIYNVSLNSKINCFPKLTANVFFDKIKRTPREYPDALRTSIRKILS